jgi:SAM-dependent methyltransferase
LLNVPYSRRMAVRKLLARFVPASARRALGETYYLVLDVVGGMFRRGDRLTPPKSMNFAGGGNFSDVGEEFKRYFVELQPSERVLDIGCAIGRMAVPLTAYLSRDGEYYGFDIVRYGIKWCQRHISKKYPNFHFSYVDIYNGNYNAAGKLRAADFIFRYTDKHFDFVFLTSVFTHMLPADLENYVSEISRVLKHGGRCLMTFFLLNAESEALIRAGSSTLDFRHRVYGCLTVNSARPEAAIAYSEDRIRTLLSKHELMTVDPIRYGSWCGRKDYVSYQDMLIAKPYLLAKTL